MPLNVLRLNQRHLHPTDRIVFIKSLPGPSSSAAESFLSRVAAICHPILTSHHLSVTTLEEFETNREFIGRNFNNGEVIQLVLRTRAGGWMPFRSVVMVMMHELAHNVQMNHGRKFWEVRNGFAEEMRGLWAKGYTGEGVWGRGRELEGGEFEGGEVEWGEEGVRQLCGGTFRSRGRWRKRKRKRGVGEAEKVDWRERERKRVERKFGRNGLALGDDEDTKVFLEGGKKVKGKPRVANSNRGRELRANAALLRFGAQKIEEDAGKSKGDEKDGNEGGDEDGSGSDYGEEDARREDAVDLNGSRLLDEKGNGMIRICEGEDIDDAYVKNEMEELQGLSRNVICEQSSRPNNRTNSSTNHQSQSIKSSMPSHSMRVAREAVAKAVGQKTTKREERTLDSYGLKQSNSEIQPSDSSRSLQTKTVPAPIKMEQPSTDESSPAEAAAILPTVVDTSPSEGSLQAECPVCSMLNDSTSWLCLACSHILKPDLSPGCWKCASSTCEHSQYLNPGDFGLCGICGASKPK